MKVTIAISRDVHTWFSRILAALQVQTGVMHSISAEVEKAMRLYGAQLLLEHQITLPELGVADGSSTMDQLSKESGT